MSAPPEQDTISLRSLTVQAILFATAIVVLGALILGFLVSPFFFLLLLAVAGLAVVPLGPPTPPRMLVGLLLVPVVLLAVPVLFVGFAYHPFFFLLLLVLAVLIVPARLLAAWSARAGPGKLE